MLPLSKMLFGVLLCNLNYRKWILVHGPKTGACWHYVHQQIKAHRETEGRVDRTEHYGFTYLRPP